MQQSNIRMMRRRQTTNEEKVKKELLQIDDFEQQNIQIYDPLRQPRPQLTIMQQVKVKKLKTQQMNTDKKIMFKETNADRNSLKETLKRLDTETDGRYFSIDYQQSKTLSRYKSDTFGKNNPQKNSLQKMRPLVLMENDYCRLQNIDEQQIIRSLIKKKMQEKEKLQEKNRDKENKNKKETREVKDRKTLNINSMNVKQKKSMSNLKNRKLRELKYKENETEILLRKNFTEHKALRKNLLLMKNRLRLPHII